MALPEKITINKDNASDTDGRLRRMYLHEYILFDADTEKSETVMIVTKVMGGWIYEFQNSNRDGRKWQPVFVPEQVDIAGALGDAIYNAITNLGSISVRQI